MLTREEVLSSALALPPADRELVAMAIQDSLETERNPAESLEGNEFHDELIRRSAAYREGRAPARPAADVMAELFQRQVEETAT